MWPGLRGDHDDVDVVGWGDGVVVDSETVAEQERLAIGEIVADVGLIDLGRGGVRHCKKDDIGAFDRLRIADDFEALRLGGRPGRAAFVEADDDVLAAVLQVEGMGVALGAEADDGEGLAF